MASSPSEYDVLQQSATALIKGLHQMILARQDALARGDMELAAQLAAEIQAAAQTYNGYVQRLNEIEGPSASLQFLSRVGDVVIEGVKAGATVALDATTNLAKAAGETASAAVKPLISAALPFVLVLGGLLVAVVFAAGKSGALRLRKVA